MIHTRAERLRTVRPSSLGCTALRLVPTLQKPTAVRTANRSSVMSDVHAEGIASLDAAAVLDLDPFKSRIRLWMEMTRRHDLLHPVHLEDEGQGYWSRLLEPIVAAHYTQRTGRQVRCTRITQRHPQHPWMLATVSREVVGSSEVQLLECLCVGMNAAPLWQHGVPEHIRWRLVHLLAVTGLRAVDLIVLLGGQDLQIYRVERDDTEIARLIRLEQKFWRCIERDQAPPSQDEDVPVFGPMS
ncbi:YqaJ viral recombinase family protein [Variovorax sp. RB2P76]|uniref:YqaJ viral recombinase family nuclease n=1 Tax=Variovorax sp. RB2P76 TaxID=3443736 RepID=UPI003F450FCA